MSAVNYTNFLPPGPGDVRSPCPGINALANHNIIPHSGKGLTVDMMRRAMEDAYNIGPDVATAFAVGGLAISSHPFSGTFDLDGVAKHGAVEHDGSLSRDDLDVTGDVSTFRKDIWDTVVGHFDGLTETTLETAAKARLDRIEAQRQRNPTFTYGPKEALLSYGETSLYLSVMGDPITGIAPVGYVRVFFEQERIPYNEGWRRPETATTFLTINTLIPKLIAAGGDKLTGAIAVSQNAIKRVFAGLDVVGEYVSDEKKRVFKFLGLEL